MRDEFENIKALKKKEVDAEREIAKQLFSGGLYKEKVVTHTKESKSKDEEENDEEDEAPSKSKSLPEFDVANP